MATSQDYDHSSTKRDRTSQLLPTPPPITLFQDDAINLCDNVRTSCRQWTENHTAIVRIHPEAVQTLAKRLVQQPPKIEWDEEEWHYVCPKHWPVELVRERTSLYLLALDAINFCFWPAVTTYEYDTLATSLTTCCAVKDHVQQEQDLTQVSADYFFSAQNLATLTVDQMKEALLQSSSDNNKDSTVAAEQQPLPPNLAQRCALWNEVGQALLEHFEGSAWRLLEEAHGSAVRAVQLLCLHFPGFRDVVVTVANDNDEATTTATNDDQEKTIYLLKRAQICVADLQASLRWECHDLDQLTTFADYRVPQILREWGVLEYSSTLQETVDTFTEIPRNSEEELSIRAATVTAVQDLCRACRELSEDINDKTQWTAVKLDWYLWQEGEKMQAAGQLAPHHRVRTIYY